MYGKDYFVLYRNPQVRLLVNKMYYTVTKTTVSFVKHYYTKTNQIQLCSPLQIFINDTVYYCIIRFIKWWYNAICSTSINNNNITYYKRRRAMWTPCTHLTDLRACSGWKYKVSDGSGDGIEVLELWFGEAVGCGATFKLFIWAGYL